MAKRVQSAPSIGKSRGKPAVGPDRAIKPESGHQVAKPTKTQRSLIAEKNEALATKVSDHLQIIFGENLKLARADRGLTQSDVAKLTGISQQYLSRVELGRRNVTLKTIVLLSRTVERDVISMLRPAETHSKKP
jgi:DNA-binding XRE family transcriptional regulator